MAKKLSGGKKKKTILRLQIQIVMAKLHEKAGLLLGGKKMGTADHQDDVERADYNIHDIYVPEDVKEGHLAVVASDEDAGDLKRFIVPLGFLSHPSFLMLLEQAAEEYGFHHHGALMVPCHPTDLQIMILKHHRQNPQY